MPGDNLCIYFFYGIDYLGSKQKTYCMRINLPHRIRNNKGEEIIFHRMENENGEEKLIIENYVAPNAKAIQHTNLKQDEGLTVLHGKMGYQVGDEEPRIATIGQTVIFKRGTPHRFWNAGEDELNCFGWIKPANNIMFYLTALYNAINEGEDEKPEQFDTAYLLYRYRKEYDMPELPRFVKSVIIPATYTIGKISGKYKKFDGAPEPVA